MRLIPQKHKLKQPQPAKLSPKHFLQAQQKHKQVPGLVTQDLGSGELRGFQDQWLLIKRRALLPLRGDLIALLWAKRGRISQERIEVQPSRLLLGASASPRFRGV
ncbi:uncharacterized protein A4U43_C06F9400 [Asparagus officinalis]|uniref:Uncharacterized protein n=1 Tax=Asparagus officinalis TaxID=4686 RepID=A0A5P1ELA6_ASPOF|nr:uncharacterized protein A4U43_C06F9400 [Asparagus officinalis]